ncbi:MAG: hypothetical protein ACOC2J_00390 [bacterium]
MALIPGFFSNNSDHKIDWKKFIVFLILCLILGIALIYFLLPGFFSGPVIERIPIIIENQNEEVIGLMELFL